MQVVLSHGDTPRDVLAETEAHLLPLGYKRLGKNGFDEINNTETAVSFGNPDKVDVGLGLDRAGYVPIRISFNGPRYKSEALKVAQSLEARLAVRWPIKEIP